MADPKFIRFARGEFAVEHSSVLAYLRWRLRTRVAGCRPLHRMAVHEVWGLGRISAANSGALRLALEVARELSVEPGWVRLESNSQRRQVFGRSGRRVVQFLSEEAEVTERERLVRWRVGTLAPRILQRSASGKGWVEEWITGRPPPAGRALKVAWEALNERLYRPVDRTREQLVEQLRGRGLEPGHRRLLDRFAPRLPRRLPCSQVHGDVWLGNMATRETNGAGGGGLVLFDWEYSREGPLSLDVWSCVFQPRTLKPDDPQGLVIDLARGLREVGRHDLAPYAGPLACLHVLDKLTWVREMPASTRAAEVVNLGLWLQSLTELVCHEEGP